MITSIETPGFADAFASAWIANWNARNVDAVLAHFADACTFESPIAEAVTGTARLHGKEALRNYWTAALARIGRLVFTLDDVSWDAERRILTVFYTSDTDGNRKANAEKMVFDAAGRQISGQAYYGANRPASSSSPAPERTP
jgi:ketosteroid isomerase-like protein